MKTISTSPSWPAPVKTIDVVGGVLVEPNDIPDNSGTPKCSTPRVKYTDKCLMGSAMGAKKARECVEMAAILFGGIDYVREHPVLVSLINTNSPLQLDQRMLRCDDGLCGI
jgi:trimethylamine---corrinoid protein Co-methyltransferase